MKDSAPRCEDVADKLVRLFGWRQTYPVQKLQRNLIPKPTELPQHVPKPIERVRMIKNTLIAPSDFVIIVISN